LSVVALGTVVLFVFTLLMGMEPMRGFFHGLWMTIGSYDTGGFSPQSSSIMYYHSWPFEIAAMILMLMGAINFALYAQVWRGGWRQTVRTFLEDIEIRTLAIWITFLVVVFVSALTAGNFLTDFSGMARRGVFTIISAATNAGYQVLTTNQLTNLLTSGAFFMVLLAMAIGGSAGSTAGGIKALRIGIIAKELLSRIKAVLAPSSARNTVSYQHLGRHLLSNELVVAAMSITLLYVVTYLFGAIVGIALGYEAIPASFESVAATTNAGLSAGIATPDAPVVLKVVYILQMWMGRLEFLTLLALLFSFVASLKPRQKVQR
jgi:trk system potassium uptake protein TrkH